MAAVIRDARMEPERVVLAVIARTPPQRAAAHAPAKTPVTAAPAPVPPAAPPEAEWTAPLPVAAAEGLQLEVDREAEEQAFRQRLADERAEALARAEAQGYAAGLERGEAGFAERIAALDAVLGAASAALESGIAGTEDVMVEIAFEAASRIIGEAMQDRAGVVAIVRQILHGVRERERLVVRVSPTDHAMLEQHRAQLLQGEDGATIELVADERVVHGGCLVETAGGTLDGRLETQLQRLAETLGSARRMQGDGL